MQFYLDVSVFSFTLEVELVSFSTDKQNYLSLPAEQSNFFLAGFDLGPYLAPAFLPDSIWDDDCLVLP